MAWVRIDDTAPHHRKLLDAGPAACWLWVCGLAYGQRLNTDVIPFKAVPVLGVTNPNRLAGFLVSAGLWHRTSEGYQIHDFHDFHATPTEREAQQLKRKDRNARYYRGSKTRLNGDLRRTEKNLSDGEPEPEPKPEPKPNKQDAAAAGPREFDRAHANHILGFCDFVCLSERKVSEFAKTLPGGLAVPENFQVALTWAQGVRDGWGDREISELKWWEFWEARWRERGTATDTKTGRTKATLQRFVERHSRDTH